MKEQRKSGEVKEKFRESEIFMGHENNVRSFTGGMYNNHKRPTPFIVCHAFIKLSY